jgi:hypothetical protein
VGQIQPALSREDVSNVTGPDLIERFGSGRVCQKVRSYGMGMLGVGGLGPESPLLTGLKVKGAHVAGDAIASATNARLAKTHRHARAAVEFAVLVKEPHQLPLQALVCTLTLTGPTPEPGVIGTARHL